MRYIEVVEYTYPVPAMSAGTKQKENTMDPRIVRTAIFAVGATIGYIIGKREARPAKPAADKPAEHQIKVLDRMLGKIDQLRKQLAVKPAEPAAETVAAEE